MKTLQEYWNTDTETATEQSNEHKAERLKLDGQKTILEAKGELKNAEQALESFMVNSAKDNTGISFHDVAAHAEEVSKAQERLAIATDIYAQLFPQEESAEEAS